MPKIYPCAAALIGGTPLVRLSRLAPNLLAKLEWFNPSGSVKDRIAESMLRAAPEGPVIEPSSGNTGIALAMLCALRDRVCTIVMPDSTPQACIAVIKAYGAEVILTPGARGMTGAIEKARQLHAETPGSVLPGQFESHHNPAAHYASTGPELWADTDGRLDILVAGAGTGGTLTGAGHYLKEQNPDIRIIAAEPAASPVLSGGGPGKYGVSGIGAESFPRILDRTVIDEVIPVTEEDALAAARLLARKEGLLCGVSSGTALHAALKAAAENPKKTVAVLLPDSASPCLSTALFGS